MSCCAARIWFTPEAIDRAAVKYAIPDLRLRILAEGGRFDGARYWLTETTVKSINPQHPALRTVAAPPPVAPAPLNGPGTELKKLLSKIGIKATANCSCNARAAEMNRNGVEWCEANIETIVGWLREEAEKRQLPFAALPARLLIHQSIRRARRADRKVDSPDR